jgi:biopolymer transport protein ExbD
MTRRRAQRDDAEINITPMLDVVFIMLIFFIVTASFVKQPGASVIKPGAEQAIAINGATLLIGVKADGAIWIDNRRIELHEIRQTVERAKAENPESRVVIMADRSSRIGLLTRIMDQVRLAGAEAVSVATEQADG